MSDCGDVIHADDKCYYSREICEVSGTFNVFQLYYCNLNGDKGFIALLFFILIFIFYLVGWTADKFLTTTIEGISEKLKCSESLSGSTLLAIANETNTVPTFVISLSGKQYDLALGGILGGGLLMCSFLIGLCLLAYKGQSEFPVLDFTRNVGFFFLGLLFILSVFLAKVIHIAQGIGILFLYAIFVVVVYFQEKYKIKKIRQNEQTNSLNPDEANNEIHQTEQALQEEQKSQEQEKQEEQEEQEEQEIQKRIKRESINIALMPTNEGLVRESISDQDKSSNEVQDAQNPFQQQSEDQVQTQIRDQNSNQETLQEIGENQQQDSEQVEIQLQEIKPCVEVDLQIQQNQPSEEKDKKDTEEDLLRSKTSDNNQQQDKSAQQNKEEEKEEIEEGPCFSILPKYKSLKKNVSQIFSFLNEYKEDLTKQKWYFTIIEVFMSTFYFIIWISVPYFEEDNWLQIKCIICPPLIGIFFAWSYNMPLDVQFFLQIEIPALIISFLIYLFSNPYKPPKYNMFLQAVGFLCAMQWLNVGIPIILDILQIICIETGIPQSVIGITVLSWGNELNDIVTDTVIAKKSCVMGTFASLVGSLVNLFLGFGIGVIVLCAKNETSISYELPMDLLVNLVVLQSVLLGAIVICIAYKGRFKRKLHAIYFIGAYVGFMVFVIIYVFT